MCAEAAAGFATDCDAARAEAAVTASLICTAVCAGSALLEADAPPPPLLPLLPLLL